MAAESYPDDLKYHPEHDWARIEGDEATLGITWYGQDALGELVHYEPPDVGATLTEGRRLRRGRVGQGGLRPDRAALGRGARGEPEGRRGARDRERGSLRRGLARADPDRRPGRGRRADGRRGVQGPPRPRCELTSRSPTPTARRCSRRSASPRSTSSSATSPRRALQGPARPRARPLRAGARRAPRGARRPQRARGRRALLPRGGRLRPLRPRGRRRRPPARRVPDRVHALPARDEPGRAPDDLRVPDGDLRADRHGRLERVRLRRHDRRRRRLLHRQARDRAVEGRPRRDAEPAGAPGGEDLRAGLRARGRRGAAPRRDDRPGRARRRARGTPPA